MYSRLEQSQVRRLRRQSLLFFLGGVGVLVLFFVVLLPIFTKMLMFGAQKIAAPQATPAVTVSSPVLNAPYTATNSAQISLSGTATSGIFVLLGQNGSIGNKVTADDKGSFTFSNVTLNQGDNLFFAYAEDTQGYRSEGSNAVTVTFSTEAPKLDVTQPADGSVVTQRKQSVVSVKGSTDPENKVYLNDQFLFVASDGSFSGSFQLRAGDNTITVKAINTAGNVTSKDLHLKYLP